MRGIIRNPINAQALPHVVKEDVARFYDRFVQIHEAVRALSVYPALELPAIKRSVRWTKCCETCGRHLVFKHGRGHDDLEYRPGRELRLDSAIQQRLCWILIELLPFLIRNSNGEIIRVGRGMADHGQDLTAARIERYHRAIASAQ